MAEPRCVLALDQGTTSSRAILFDRGGEVMAVAQREFPQHYPRPGWVEHDPADLWSGIAAVAAEVRARAGIGWGEVAAVGIANQRETVLVWERSSGRPIYPAVVWQDRRTAGRCEELRASGVEDEVRRRTGLRLDPYFSATKVAWVLDEVAGARRAAERGELCFGTVDSWLLWHLTGGARHLTDATNASRTLLYDVGEGGWSEWLCELFGVPMACLPEICDSSGELAESVWGVPLCGVAGDQHAALFGQACHRRGMAKNTYGTGCFLLLHTGDELVLSENGLLGTVAWRIGGRVEYALEGSVFVGGAVVQWLRDELGVVGSAAECDRLAGEVDDAGGLVLVPAFTGLGAPHWLARARGVAVGITRGTGRRQFCRAALESIALQSADLLDCMEADSGVLAGQLRVDGGASRSDLLMQIQADLLGREVVRPRVVETTALGAAYLAGLGSGFWRGRDEIAANWAVDRAFEPTWDEGRREELRSSWRAAVGLLGGGR